MTTISGGSITVEDGVKSAQEYAPARKVSVTLAFDVEHGSDARVVMEHVGNLANNQVRRLLHQAPEEITSRAETALAAALPPVAPQAEGPSPAQEKPEEPVKRGRGRPPKMRDLAPAFRDPADIDDEPVTVAAAPEPEADEPTASGDPVYTDQDLHHEIQKRNGIIRNSAAIKALIVEYRTDPYMVWTASCIPAEKRHDFVTKLHALPKGPEAA